MNFDEFASVYAALRVRSGRADDLHADVHDDVEEHISSNSGEGFILRLDVANGYAWMEVYNENVGTIIHASANIATREVHVSFKDFETSVILEMFSDHAGRDSSSEVSL